MSRKFVLDPPLFLNRVHFALLQMHVMGVFNLPESWAVTAQETLRLFALYGPGGTEFEDRRIIDMMDEIPPVTGKIQAAKFLDRLLQLDREQNDN
jgi:hypothetical protein